MSRSGWVKKLDSSRMADNRGGFGSLSAVLEKGLARAKAADRTFMAVLAVVIGIIGGLGAVGFRLLIELVQRYAWGRGPYSLDLVLSHPSWWIILVPAIGGAIVGPLVYYLAREARGHGVPEVMYAVAVRSGEIRPRLVMVKTLASALTR